jgi:hypothetical protein
MRREGVGHVPVPDAVVPRLLLRDDGLGLGGGIDGIQGAGQIDDAGGRLRGREALYVDWGGHGFVGGIHRLEDQRPAVFAPRGGF